MKVLFLDDRPVSRPFKGRFKGPGVDLILSGELTFDLAGRTKFTGKGKPAKRREIKADSLLQGHFRGRLDTGDEVVDPAAWMSLGGFFVPGISEQYEVSCWLYNCTVRRRIRPGRLPAGGELEQRWVLTHTDLLKEVAWTHPSVLMEILARVSTELLEGKKNAYEILNIISRKQPTRGYWEVDGAQVLLVYEDASVELQSDITGIPLRKTVSHPRIVIKSPIGTGRSILKIARKGQMIVGAMLDIFGILSGERVEWYACHEVVRGPADAQGFRDDCHQAVRYQVINDRKPINPHKWRPHSPMYGLIQRDLPKLIGRVRRRSLPEMQLFQAALASFLMAMDSDDLWIKFTMLMTALESQKELFLLNEGKELSKNVSDDDYPALEKAVRDAVKKWGKDQSKKRRELIYQKVRELQRPSLKAVLKEMCSSWKVHVDDLDPTWNFVEIRNAMVHSGIIPVPNAEFVAAAKNVERLVERIFCRAILGIGPEPYLPGWEPPLH